MGMFLCRLLLQKVYGLGQWFSTWGRFRFFQGTREASNKSVYS